MVNNLRLSPYYWKYDGVQVEGEFRLPVDNSPSAPTLGAGSKRWNPTTTKEETWNGTGWLPTGNDTSGVVTGTYSVTGDGLTSDFSWPHGLGYDPSIEGFTIDPKSTSAQGIYEKSADATYFFVAYDICPTGTLFFNWTANKQ